MKNVLLDSSVIIEFIRVRDKSKTHIARLTQEGTALSISIVTYFEAYAGRSIWEKPQARQAIQTLLAGMEIVTLDTTIAQRAGEIRARYGLSAMDAIIASTALNNHLQLVTLNRKDFEKVPGLELFPVTFKE